MDKAYEPKKYEENILKKWNDAKAFIPKMPSESKTGQSYTIPLPPPNVTGTLHLGHAMMLVVEDIMARYHRMKGDATLWVPGTDHAAIATESVVLKNLGVPSREVFSREVFLEKCFEHTRKSQATITNQVKKMGSSCDFTRERYTMDLGMSNAVWKIFKDLYEAGLIVRGYRMVNWSPKAQSVLADDELESEERKESFSYIKCGRFVIGTVRSETKCADSPVVIHPDENYVVARFTPSGEGNSEEFVFSEVLFDDIERRNKVFNLLPEGTWEKVSVHPGNFFEGESFEAETYAGKRNFFVMCDGEVIDIHKGTGAMTISVNHAPDDYLLAQKYPEQLKPYYIEKIGFDGKMTAVAGELAGVEVEIARKRAIKIMKEKNLLVGLDTQYSHAVPLCYRTGCVVEPMISPQWFISVEKEFLWQENVGVVKNTKDAKNLSPKNGKIFFARHGESEGNVQKIFQGRLDVDLTEKGKQDAQQLSQTIKENNITTIIASNLRRAQHTAQIVKKELGILSEIIIIPELNELDWAEYEGKSWDITGEKRSIEFYLQNNICESSENIYARVQKAKQKIIEIAQKNDGNILVVSHGQFSAFIFAEANNIPYEEFLAFYKTYETPKNGEVRELDYTIPSPIKTTLKELTLSAVQDGGVQIIPERFNKIYFQWIENLRDWCISRQIWWGHQIPIWYDENGIQHVAHEQKLIFARHGESEDNVQNKIGGNSPLTEKGKRQAEELAEKLILEERKISKIYYSSLKRSKETAEIIASKLKIELEEFPDFHEIYTGALEGSEKQEQSTPTLQTMLQQNTGETLEQIENRAKKFWDTISKMHPQHGDMLFIGHRSFLSMVFGVKDGRFGETLLDYRNRWSMQNGEEKEVLWMMKPKGENLKQDSDTLDTWFSSALWPFSTLGWPDRTSDLENFFPTNVLETGHDILFFWVARMIMFGRFATGKNPFKDVYLHGLVCDEHGKKMSKSKGNGIDPLDMIEKYGTDALRMALVVGTTPGNQVNLGEKKIEGFRNFANKLWNISRYIKDLPRTHEGEIDSMKVSLPEQWILGKLQTIIREVSEGLEEHKYGEVGQKLYDFTWNDVADWAIESAKAVESKTIGNTLQYVLETLLKLLHPYIPFVTEQIWQEMGNTELLLLQEFPNTKNISTAIDAEKSFTIIQSIISSIRSLRAASKVDPTKKIKAIFNIQKQEFYTVQEEYLKIPENQREHIRKKSFLQKNEAIIKLLARLESVEYSDTPNEECVSDIVNGVEIYLPLSGMLDQELEKARKAKELEEAKKQLATLESRLSNEKYMASAPAHLVEQTKLQYAEIQAKIALLSM